MSIQLEHFGRLCFRKEKELIALKQCAKQPIKVKNSLVAQHLHNSLMAQHLHNSLATRHLVVALYVGANPSVSTALLLINLAKINESILLISSKLFSLRFQFLTFSLCSYIKELVLE